MTGPGRRRSFGQWALRCDCYIQHPDYVNHMELDVREAEYEKIVRRYLAEVRPDARKEMLVFERMPSLEDAITSAALCILPDGKRHPHQYRIPASSLEQARRALLQVELSKCQSFDELHQMVGSSIGDIFMVGVLTIYDISHRIGAFLRLEPEFVYLHRGVIEGAKALGLQANRGALPVQALPKPFRRLKAYEIEDCLCIFKSELAGVRSGLTNACIRQPRRRQHCS